MITSCESTKPQICQSENCCSAVACTTMAQPDQDMAQMHSDHPQKKFRISNMDCASEES